MPKHSSPSKVNRTTIIDTTAAIGRLSIDSNTPEIKHSLAKELITFSKEGINSPNLLSSSPPSLNLNGIKTLYPDKSNIKGIVNLSNTCYANAILQSLFYIPRFAKLGLLLYKYHLSNLSRSNNHGVADLFPLLTALGKFFSSLDNIDGKMSPLNFTGADNCARPDAVFSLLRGFFNGHEDVEKQRLEIETSLDEKAEIRVHIFGPQQDAQEFLNFLLTQLHEEQVNVLQHEIKVESDGFSSSNISSLSTHSESSNQNQEHVNHDEDDGWQTATRTRRPPQKAQNAGLKSDHLETCISVLFQGKLRNTYAPANINAKKTISAQPFFCLPLEVDSKDIDSIEESLELYFEKEEQKDDHGKKVGVHYTELEALPYILILQLKRFAFNRKTGESFKVRKRIDFPKKLDISSQYMSRVCRDLGNSNEYTLSSVVCHQGRGIHSGHYVNYSFDEKTNGWRLCNDEDVRVVSEEEVLEQKDAYLLFYQRL